MRIYLAYLKILIQAQLQNRAGFVLLTFGQILGPLFVWIGMVFLFQRFGSLAGWSAAEVGLVYGVTQLAFALGQAFGRGFDQFSSVLRQGEFDRLLVRPRGAAFQVLVSRVDLTKLGRLLLGIGVIAGSAAALDRPWDGLRTWIVATMVVSGTGIFVGLYQAGAALCFKTLDGLEVVNIVTDGGREASQYPLVIYPPAVAAFLTFVVPFGCFNTVPLLWVLDKPGGDLAAALAAPWLGLLFLVPCGLLWRWGVRHYSSAGS